MKQIFRLSLAVLIFGAPALSSVATDSQVIVIPNLANRFNNNAMTITPNSPFFRANQFALTHPGSGQNLYFIAPNPGGSPEAFAVPDVSTLPVPGFVPNTAPRSSGRISPRAADREDLIRGFSPPNPAFSGGFEGSPFVAGPFVTPPAGQGPPNVPNSAMPDAPLNSVPGPATNAVPLPPGSMPGFTNNTHVFPAPRTTTPGTHGTTTPGVSGTTTPNVPGGTTHGTPNTTTPSAPGTTTPGRPTGRGM